jgi:hypothetical protein
MPVDFLTAEQARRYGRYNGDPTPAQLAKYFFLDDKERREIAAHRGAHNRLGYAAQLCTARFLGTFLPDPTNVPQIVVKHLACQLGIGDPSRLTRYGERPTTYANHAVEICQCHGYRDFASQPEHWRLVATVRDRAAERLWRTLAELPNRTQRKRLETLLLIPESSRVSLLDRLRKAPVHISAPGWWRHCSGSTSFAGWVWEA